MIKKITFGFIILFFSVNYADATIPPLDYYPGEEAVITSFRNVVRISNLEIPIEVPTVVEVELPDGVYSGHFAVGSYYGDGFEPYLYINETNDYRNYERVKEILVDGWQNSSNLVLNDYSYETSKDFDLNQEGDGYTEIKYIFDDEIRSNSISLFLDQYVSLPNFLTLTAVVDGQEKIILSKVQPFSGRLTFPETISKEWNIYLLFSQPLRINELQINNLDSPEKRSKIRFLAQPDKDYYILLNPETIIPQETGERPNLSSDEDVYVLSTDKIIENIRFKLADTDRDGVPDLNDNCVRNRNEDQLDVNNNGRGDVCDDYDRDGIINSVDNCVNEPNRNQADIDNDGLGDVCDGEESRLTEKYPMIVWGALGLAALIFGGLFAVALRRIRFREEGSFEEGQEASKDDHQDTNYV